ncbi:MAG: PcfB family protein [Clostridia bacterium]|nr:PcfB family protein [Clostridia bacterium]
MSLSSDVAEQVVRLSLYGAEMIMKLTGSGAKNAAMLIASAIKGSSKNEGSVRLSRMLEGGKPLMCYEFDVKDVDKFRTGAREYGIMYNVVKEKGDAFKTFDVFIKKEDVPRFERMCKRFSLKLSQDLTIEKETAPIDDGAEIFEVIEDDGGINMENIETELAKLPPLGEKETADALLGLIQNPDLGPDAEKSNTGLYKDVKIQEVKESQSGPKLNYYETDGSRSSVRSRIRTIRSERERLSQKNIRLVAIKEGNIER